jgi:hypothetical protein
MEFSLHEALLAQTFRIIERFPWSAGALSASAYVRVVADKTSAQLKQRILFDGRFVGLRSKDGNLNSNKSII